MGTNEFDQKALLSRINILLELIESKTSQLNLATENFKRIDGYALGCKESNEKIKNHISSKNQELRMLLNQGKLSKEIFSFLENVLNGVALFAKSIESEAERLFYSKQGEMVFLKEDIDKLIKLKNTHEQSLKNQELEKQQKELEKQQKEPAEQQKEESTKRIRPDKNPNTRIGRAALDLAKRRKSAKENLKNESTSKRGRKSKKVEVK